MKVVFLGNHTVGVTALKALLDVVEVVGVVAHPDDPEDGVRYESVYSYAIKQGLSVIRGRGKEQEIQVFIESIAPDLIWVTDYRYLLPQSLVEVAPFGAVNLHPSLLPRYRGRASINWAILLGEQKIGLTAHFIAEGADTGDIIEQVPITLSDEEDVGDALDKLMPVYYSLTKRVIGYFVQGKIPRTQQVESLSSEFPARKQTDGRIDWMQSAEQIRNLVRAVAAPYPGAYTECNGKQLYIWKAKAVKTESGVNQPGLVFNVQDEIFDVQCGEGVLRVLESKGEPEISIGLQLE